MGKWTREISKQAMQMSYEEFSKLHHDLSSVGWYRHRRRVRSGQLNWSDDSPATQESLDTIEGIEEKIDRPPFEVKENGDIFINYISRTVVTNLGPEFGSITVDFERHSAM